MLSESMPILCGSIASFELLMAKWERLGKEHPELQYWTRVGLLWVQKYYKQMDDTDAYVIAMGRSLFSDYSVTESHYANSLSIVLNPAIRFSWIQRKWDSIYIQRSKKIMLDVVSA
jgi:hypothetical protein